MDKSSSKFVGWQKRQLAFAVAFASIIPLAHSALAANNAKPLLVAMGVVPMVPVHRGVGLGRVHSSKNSRTSRIGRDHRQKENVLPVKPVAPIAAPALKAEPAKTTGKPVVKPISVGSHALHTVVEKTLYDGVSYKVLTGQMASGGRVRINLIDMDMARSQAVVRPVAGSTSFARLKDVREHSRDSGAIAAINANYFKTNGVPLGTLIQNGDWLAGPLYDRVTLGFTEGGYARIARVSLHGLLYTESPEHPTLWINNVNQPRRTGSHCILYTRHWGSDATLPYPGILIAVDSSGRVIDRDDLKMSIPYGGFVLADSKGSPIGDLRPGEQVNIDWQIHPGSWNNVTEAVSGGPLLLQNGKPVFDLKAEKFPASFAGSHIHQRTACGITNDDHLLMATFEGPHTLYDIGKFFLARNCSDAMNLDGGGSTTMVVDGKTVTANANHAQRRVAVALGIFSPEKAGNLAGGAAARGSNFRPSQDISSFVGTSSLPFERTLRDATRIEESDPLMTSLMKQDLLGQSDEVRAAACATQEDLAAASTKAEPESISSQEIEPTPAPKDVHIAARAPRPVKAEPESKTESKTESKERSGGSKAAKKENSLLKVPSLNLKSIKLRLWSK